MAPMGLLAPLLALLAVVLVFTVSLHALAPSPTRSPRVASSEPAAPPPSLSLPRDPLGTFRPPAPRPEFGRHDAAATPVVLVPGPGDGPGPAAAGPDPDSVLWWRTLDLPVAGEPQRQQGQAAEAEGYDDDDEEAAYEAGASGNAVRCVGALREARRLRSLLLAQARALATALAPAPALARTAAAALLQGLAAAQVCSDGTAYVITGDIRPMWLRDSAAQLQPFLPALAAGDRLARRLFRGLLRRHLRYIAHDPYANAFRLRPRPAPLTDRERQLGRSPLVATRNYELDSHCYFLLLCAQYWDATADAAFFRRPGPGGWADTARSIMALWRREQRHEAQQEPAYRYPELVRQGRGPPSAYTGMTWSGFRPSDEPCTFPYLVPANMMVVLALRRLARLARQALLSADGGPLAAEAEALAEEVDAGIHRHGVFRNASLGPLYAFEVDGLGGALLADDANVPSLLAIPYLAYRSPRDPRGLIARNTRAFVLSPANRFYVSGPHASGVGSSHTPARNVWPMSLIVQALGSRNETEVLGLLRTLLATHAGTFAVHESFSVDLPSHYTRPWFGWAGALLAELLLRHKRLLGQRLLELT